jgi:ectoine hydroxylase-related dioxygenase (phytanoyl-CoA dioxygenase family)
MSLDSDRSRPLRAVTDAERKAYRSNGAVVLRGVLPRRWIELMQVAVDEVLRAPGPASVEYARGSSGRYLGDFFIWMRHPTFRDFALASPLPILAQQIMESRCINLFYDQLLVKEPQTVEETPWHQDLPYWPLRGNDIVSLWIAFDEVSADAGAMRYVRGSHRQGAMYAPRAFAKDSGYADIYARMGLPPFPDIDAASLGDELMVCPVEPGDIIAHHPLTFHSSPGNLSRDRRRRALALRYLGDDAIFDARPGTFIENPRVAGLLKEPMNYRDGDRLGGANFPDALNREDSSP